MTIEELQSPLESITGLGPKTASLFTKLNVSNVGQLLTFYPRTYEDRRERVYIKDYKSKVVHTIVIVKRFDSFTFGGRETLKLVVSDGYTEASLVCFNRPFFSKLYPIGSVFCLYAQCEYKYNSIQTSSFDIVKNDLLTDSVRKKVYNLINPPDSSPSPLTQSLYEKYAFSQGFFDSLPLPDSSFIPIYPLTAGLTQKELSLIMHKALSQFNKALSSSLPEAVIKKRSLLSKQVALQYIHTPTSMEEVEEAKKTLIYEELFNFQKEIAVRIYQHKRAINPLSPSVENKNTSLSLEPKIQPKEAQDSFNSSLSPLQKSLLNSLSFSLTPDQRQVIIKMGEDIDKSFYEYNLFTQLQKLSKGSLPSAPSTSIQEELNTYPLYSMRRLLQGDVGAGKTLVSFFLALRAIEYKAQVALMCPTEVLARQHAMTAQKLLSPFGIKVAFLSASLNSKVKKALLKALYKGEVDFIIGTHALFSASVSFKNLRLVIIDEQHRFGVLQRQRLMNKGQYIKNLKVAPSLLKDKFPSFTSKSSSGKVKITLCPNLLMMSATPIPQSLALTMYGDLDISTIKTLPSGRRPIITYLNSTGHENRVYERVRQELEAGHQAYFIYPAIEECENGQDLFSNSELKAVKVAFDTLSHRIYPSFNCALLHSKVSEDEQIETLNAFQEGKVQVLVSTTIIEVGVDIPQATCIIIMQAQNFGLSQLHQLRGRVGRGSLQSYCFLVYDPPLSKEALARLKAVRYSTDGFTIAEEDLKIRGPGQLLGTEQAGELRFRLADINRDISVLQEAREDAFRYVEGCIQGMEGE